MNSVFQKTVKPMTAFTTMLTVYTKGYYDAVTDLHLNRMPSFTSILLGVTESSLFGYCIGMTYPVSIPIIIGSFAYISKPKN
jgi:hypothetical protein